jgi:hypothetical protein
MPPRKRRHDRYLRLRRCPEYQDLIDRLYAGWGVGELAAWLSTTGAGHGIKPASLRRTLLRLRDDLDLDPVAREERLDELRALINLYVRQDERIQIDIAIERLLAKLLPTVRSDIAVACQVLQLIHEVRLLLGLPTPRSNEGGGSAAPSPDADPLPATSQRRL